MWLTRVSINNPYFATVIMLLLVILGVLGFKELAVEEFPNVSFPVAIVSTVYKGASPEVIETDISKKIEETLNTISGVKTIRSYSFEGQSTVVVEFNLDVNSEDAIQDVRDKIAVISSTFSKDVDIPTVSKVDIQDEPIMSVVISNPNLSIRDLTTWVNKIAKKKLQVVNGVGDVKVIGGVDRQVRVNVKPYALEKVRLSVLDVVNAIQAANNNYPAGNISYGNSSLFNVRLNGKLQTINDFKKIIIKYRGKYPIYLSDVASVEDGQDEYKSLTLFNGNRAVGLDIRSASEVNIVAVSKLVRQAIKELESNKPIDTTIVISKDKSDSIQRSIDDVESTLLEGAILTVIIVFLFLKSWRSTVITGLTLPISIIGTMFVMHLLAFTINVISLLALSLAIGLLIDDAIVVRENIMRHIHMGKNHRQASLEGTNEIGLAVLATTLTLVAVFLPIGFMKGIIGKFFYQFGITVSVSVLISLMVSFSLDPMLSSIWHEPTDGGWLGRSWVGKQLNKFEQLFDYVNIVYEKFIRWSLKNPKKVLFVTFSILILSFGLMHFVGGEFIPKADKGKLTITFKTPVGSDVEYTEMKINQAVQILQQNIKEITMITGGVNKNFGEGRNNATLTLDVGDKTYRKRSIDEIMKQARSLLENMANIEITSVIATGGVNSSNKPINIDIQGENLEVLKNIALDLIKKLESIPNATDISSSFQVADPAVNIDLHRDIAANLGISLANVGSNISYLFAGNKISSWEDPIDGDNYDVVIQIPKADRLESLLDIIKIPSSQNDTSGLARMVPLSVLASTSYGLSPHEIDHINLMRKVTVTGNIIGSDQRSVYKKINNILSTYQMPKGYMLNQSGNAKDLVESFLYALEALATGIIFIYLILVAQFRSFLLPVIIMIALPLSFIGVFIALFITGSTLNMFSMIGIIMLMGLATKNGILLIDFINQQIDGGIELVEAIINAGKTRLRPIVMTSLAMIFGMLPLALGNGITSATRKSMAYAIIGGLITSTVLTLICLPVIYKLMSKWRHKPQHIDSEPTS